MESIIFVSVTGKTFQSLIHALCGFLFGILHEEVCLWCSNNAMGLWSKIKGKGTDFKGPPSVGQVLMFTFPVLLYIELGLFNFDNVLDGYGFYLGIQLKALNNDCRFILIGHHEKSP